METLETSRVCRLCGQQSGISINIFDENESHVRKINAVLPIMVHEMDLLPKHMCHRCSYKLEEFHKFYVDCLKTDAALKGQLSWMRKERRQEEVGVPMVQIENAMIKSEPLEYDAYELEAVPDDQVGYAKPMDFQRGAVRNGGLLYAQLSRCSCCCDNSNPSRRRSCRDYSRPSLATAFAEDALRTRGTTTTTVFGRCRRAKSALTETPRNLGDDGRAAVRGRMVRNLRPRNAPVNYAANRKRRGATDARALDGNPLKATKASETEAEFELARQIKLERMDEYVARRLRPRNIAVSYYEHTRRRTSKLAATRRRRCGNATERRKRRKSDPAGLLRTVDQGLLAGLKLAIKRETAVERTDGETRRIGKRRGGAKCRRVTCQPSQSRPKFQLCLRRRATASAARGRPTRRTTSRRYSAANYSPKCLRSQDVFLRNGKPRRRDVHADEWSMGRLRRGRTTRRRTAAKLQADSVKHYCDTCNLSFVNKELFRLHACYYD